METCTCHVSGVGGIFLRGSSVRFERIFGMAETTSLVSKCINYSTWKKRCVLSFSVYTTSRKEFAQKNGEV